MTTFGLTRSHQPTMPLTLNATNDNTHRVSVCRKWHRAFEARPRIRNPHSRLHPGTLHL